MTWQYERHSVWYWKLKIQDLREVVLKVSCHCYWLWVVHHCYTIVCIWDGSCTRSRKRFECAASNRTCPEIPFRNWSSASFEESWTSDLLMKSWRLFRCLAAPSSQVRPFGEPWNEILCTDIYHYIWREWNSKLYGSSIVWFWCFTKVLDWFIIGIVYTFFQLFACIEWINYKNSSFFQP